MIRVASSAVLLLALTAIAGHAHAQQDGAATVATDTAGIAGRAGQAMTGRAAINQAAGAGNVQANLAAIALAPGANAVIEVRAQQHAQAGDRRRNASAQIAGQALAGSNGVLSVNQVAGSGNTQLNVFALGNAAVMLAASGLDGLDDAALAAVAGDAAVQATPTAPGQRHAVIGNDAFHGSQGVVQVNQTAGVGNASVNAIVLQLPGGRP